MDYVYFIESNLTGYGAAGLRLARERGLMTNFVAREPAEYASLAIDPTTLADTVSVVDTFDISKLFHFFSGRKPRGVLAFDDYRLIPAALVGERLGLPHADVAGLVNTHFKDRTRECTKGIGGAVEAATLSLDEPGSSAPLPYPCVVKPIDDSGSTGVRICADDDEYLTAVDAIRARPVNLRNYHCAPRFLVEQFIGGDEFTAEVMWDTTENRWRLMGFTKKLMAEPPFRVELGAMFPYVFDPDTHSYIEDVIYAWLDATGHRYGAAHVEFKLCDGQPTLMEINPRLGGDQIRELILRTYGYDSIDLYLRLYLGEPAVLAEPKRDGFATIYYLTPPRPGRIECVIPPDTPAAGVVRSSLITGGFDAHDVRDNDDRLGYVITQADDFGESYRLALDFMARARVVYAD